MKKRKNEASEFSFGGTPIRAPAAPVPVPPALTEAQLAAAHAERTALVQEILRIFCQLKAHQWFSTSVAVRSAVEALVGNISHLLMNLGREVNAPFAQAPVPVGDLPIAPNTDASPEKIRAFLCERQAAILSMSRDKLHLMNDAARNALFSIYQEIGRTLFFFPTA